MKRSLLHRTQKYFYLAFSSLMVTALPAFAQTFTQPQLGPNLVKNAGFEEGTTGWNIPAGTAKTVSDVAHSGKSSLYYSNTDAARYKMFSQKLKVQPGQHLVFSVWVKGQNISGKEGAGLYVQSYANGKYIGGGFPSTITGTYDWQQVKGEYSVPANATDTSVGLYLRKGITGTAWFDDVEVRVEKPEPFASFLKYPNYRGTIVQDDHRPWNYLVRINADPEWTHAPVKISTELTDSAGKVLLKKENAVASSATTATVTLDAPRNLPLGKYTLTQRITDPEGEVRLTSRHTICVVQKMPKVYIDAEGFTVVDGKRFFPLGVYLGPTSDEDLARISGGGFNTILAYGYGSGKDPEAYMERAARHHLKVVYSVKDMYPNLRGASPDSLEKAAGYIKMMRDKPNLLGWYTNDELAASWLPQLQKMYDQVKELDPNHPAYQVLYQIGILEKYFDVTDVLGTDPYPVGSADLTKTSTNTRITISATHGAKGVWMVPQFMDWAVYHADRKQHPPTLDEMRNQSYQALINGATGLIFYSYYDMMYEKYPRGESTKNMELFKKRWADASSMAEEINKIIPIVLKGNNRVALDLPKNADVETGALRDGNQLLLMLANPYYETKSISFALPAGWAIKEATQGEIKSTFANGKATFTLPSVGSGVFRLVRN